MEEIIIQPHPNQTFDVILGNQNCTVKLYQVKNKMFLDLAIDNTWVSYGNICLNRTSILQFIGSDFKGILFFIDTEGSSNPTYEYIGSRYKLIYAENESELPEGALT